MKQIPLTQGKFAFVSDRDYWLVRQFRWFAQVGGRNWYAVAHADTRAKFNNVMFSMHRLIAGFPPFRLDHKNGDGLNNCRGNLRPATHSQNLANHRRQCNNKSGYIGVSWNKRRRKWYAFIHIGKSMYLGSFTNRVAAAGAYAMAARLYFGEYARY
jgi:hypothetical protein